MRPDHFFTFIVVIVAISVISSMITKLFKSWMAHRERMLALKAQQGNQDSLQARIDKLESRMRVLERLATDKGRHLADEIDQLNRTDNLRDA